MEINIKDYFDQPSKQLWLKEAMSSLKLKSESDLEDFILNNSLEGLDYAANYDDEDLVHELATFPVSRLLARKSRGLMKSDQENGVNFCLSENHLTSDGIFLLTKTNITDLPAEVNLDYMAILDEFNFDLKKAQLWIQKLSKSIKVFPYLNLAKVHNAGASITQEIAMMLGLIEFTNEICANQNTVFIEVGCDSKYFNTIAKLRAIRYILESISNQTNQFEFEILTSTSQRESTLYDPWVNMLRETSSTSSAFLGGANTLILSGYDSIAKEVFSLESTSELSLRQSRNIYHILNEESHLADVLDPCMGSFCIESLTRGYIDASFALFKQLESRGGLLQNITQFSLEVEKTSVLRSQLASQGKLKLVGINSFSNTDEKIEQTFKLDVKPIDIKTDISSIYFPLRREAQKFEQLRLKASSIELNICIVAFGPESKLSARIMFCIDFFEVLGQKVSLQFIKEESELTQVDAKIIVLCALDADYDIPLSWKWPKMVKYIAGNKITHNEFINVYAGQNRFDILNELVQKVAK